MLTVFTLSYAGDWLLPDYLQERTQTVSMLSVSKENSKHSRIFKSDQADGCF